QPHNRFTDAAPSRCQLNQVVRIGPGEAQRSQIRGPFQFGQKPKGLMPESLLKPSPRKSKPTNRSKPPYSKHNTTSSVVLTPKGRGFSLRDRPGCVFANQLRWRYHLAGQE